MTHEEKINYMRISTGIAGYGLDKTAIDMFVSLYELIIKKEGKTDLLDICKIESEVKEREKSELETIKTTK